MTDRHAGYLVILGEDIREDDAEHVLNAIRMISGVISVTPVLGDYQGDYGQAIGRIRRDREWAAALRPLFLYGPGGQPQGAE